jgi:hypothetical protein
MVEADAAGIVANRPSQPSFGHELVQRMARRARPSLVVHDGDHAAERVLGGELAVDHGGELTVRFSDADFELTAGDTCDLEASQFAAEMTVLGYHVDAGVQEQRGEVRRIRWWRWCRERLRFCCTQLGAPQPPHRRRARELRRPASEKSRVSFDDEMQLVGLVVPRPRERQAEGSDGVVVGEHPCRRTGDTSRAAGEGRCRGVVDTEVARDQRAETDVEERGGALGIQWSYDDFLRRP